MSDLSAFLHKIGAFLTSPTVANVPGVVTASAQVAQAATAVESVLPGIAKVAADAALAAAGPIGIVATPFANNFIDLLIDELGSRKTVPATTPTVLPTGAQNNG